jgi:hypothetical protein
MQETIDSLERELLEHDRAACVGSHGGFVDFRLAVDRCYIERGSFQQPFEADVVSGFLFCIKWELFAAPRAHKKGRDILAGTDGKCFRAVAAVLGPRSNRVQGST